MEYSGLTNLGFNMAGTEPALTLALLNATRKRRSTFVYLELGIATGQTLLAVHRWLLNRAPEGLHCFGVDLVGGPYFNSSVLESVPKEHRRSIHVFLGGSALFCTLTTSALFGTVNFCLIDGCHGKACVISDFLGVEPMMAPGSTVAFHDACEEDQGVGFQAHCQEPINVRAALQDLGLLDGSRPGWKFIAEAHGDKQSSGNGFVFVQKDG